MLLDAVLLVQDVQLICFCILFGVLAMQKWKDQARRWLWFSFLANGAGSVLDILAPHLPTWLGRSANELMIPLSYALLNVSLAYFDKRGRRAVWLSGLILLAGFPILLAWRDNPIGTHRDGVADLLIALECMITSVLMFHHREKATRAPRLTISGFLAIFVVVELARVVVSFPMHGDPDVTTPRLAMVCLVAYITNVSLLPLAFIWMMQSRLEWDLYQQSIADPLTCVLNRRGLERALELELTRHRRYGQELTVVILDLDHFKDMNDRFGHVGGDAILIAVARFLTSQLRRNDVMGRFGGEEFVLLLPHTDIDGAAPVVERLCESLAEYRSLLPDVELTITASFGVAASRGRRSLEPSDLLTEADSALYRAKANGRNRVCYFRGPADAAAVEEAGTERSSFLSTPSAERAPDRPTQRGVPAGA